MKKINLILMGIILVTLVLISFAFAEENKIYNVFFNYDGNNLNFDKVIVTQSSGTDKKFQPIEGYVAELISFEDNVLSAFKFDIPNKILVSGGGEIILDSVNFSIDMPYFSNGKTINILDPNKNKILEISVEHFSNLDSLSGTSEEDKISKRIIANLIIFLVLIFLIILWKKFLKILSGK